MRTVLIGFGYKARRGKDTAVSTIIAQRGSTMDIRRYAFADILKQEMNQAAERVGGMFNLYEMLLNRRISDAPPLAEWVKYDANPMMTDPFCPLGKQRDMLQWWGTEYRRKQNPYYWVCRLSDKIAEDSPQVALISDVRMMNEYQWIVSKGGHTVKLSRMGFQDEGINALHVSETTLDGMTFDYEVQVMDGDLEELKRCAVQVFDMIIDSYRPPEFKEFFPTVITSP